MTRVLVELDNHATFDEWQPYARYLLNHNVMPDQVHWQSGDTQDLFHQSDHAVLLTDEIIQSYQHSTFKAIRVNKAFLPLAKYACCHSATERFAILYRLLWRLAHEDSLLLANAADPDVHLANVWAKAVGRDRHKMKAFVRFKKSELI